MRRTPTALAAWALLAACTSDLAPRRDPDVPEQVRIAFGEDPRTTMRVAWCVDSRPTAPRLRDPGVVVRRVDAPAATERRVDGERRFYPQETFAPWEATLAGLAPGALYEYRVEGAHGATGWSRFRTAPAGPEPFTFVAFGDHGVSAASERLAARVAEEAPAFVLLLGDLAYANGDQRIWDAYGRMLDPFFRGTPLMAAVGNHEYETYGGVDIGTEAYRARFALPGDEHDYVFDYAGVRFVVVDGTQALRPSHLERLDRTLAEARRDGVRRLIVAQHYPHFGSASGRGLNVPLLQAQGPLFERHRVDLVLNGHDHFYERTFPIRGGRPSTSERSAYRTGEGAIHVVAGGGGAKLYDFQPGSAPASTCVRVKSHGYLRVAVASDGGLEATAVDLDGATIDRFVLAPP
ncbi:MAG TPA: metallophosphoesterase family protein [Planctomycetota bacterium]|nr:metallophosphoesterase family protein [Planctomycetota bacterium]